jgi:hypothetical protein
LPKAKAFETTGDYMHVSYYHLFSVFRCGVVAIAPTITSVLFQQDTIQNSGFKIFFLVIRTLLEFGLSHGVVDKIEVLFFFLDRNKENQKKW